MSKAFNHKYIAKLSNNRSYCDLNKIASVRELDALPYSIRVLLECTARNLDNYIFEEKDMEALLTYHKNSSEEIAFKPSRVILQDFTGVPAVVDLAAMRSALKRMNGDVEAVNPQVKVDLVIDHSLQVDDFGKQDSLEKNMQTEFARNKERYEFLKWGQQAFKNFNIIPPGVGIVHQVNLEYLASLILEKDSIVYPDSLVGTDSHTTMINGLGVLGWGVGGLEAEAVMLGEAIYMLIPKVVGCKLVGKLPNSTTATDLVLTITQTLRRTGVVGKFVEFYGDGLDALSLPDRATIANMAPEYGATCGFFPVDEQTCQYALATGRKNVPHIKEYYSQQGMFRTSNSPSPTYTQNVEINLDEIVSSVAGPKKPQDRIPVSQLKQKWQEVLQQPVASGGYGLKNISETPSNNGNLNTGDIAIAAITSCTNTSNPSVMIAAGLLAKKAVDLGLSIKPYVKTSLAPGSRVVAAYLEKAGLLSPLEKLGFSIVGYACTTCIGNSGPLATEIVEQVKESNVVLASVLSGNRNFEGRISPHVKANFLASPPLVIAYALAGTIDINLLDDPIGKNSEMQDVFLKDIWPSPQEIKKTIEQHHNKELYEKQYAKVYQDNPLWDQISTVKGSNYTWDAKSTYIQEPNFFTDMSLEIQDIASIENARCLVKLGDYVTTDHISPAGAIPADMPAGRYLQENNITPSNFNSFGSRRGNDRVMTRGTFGNIRLRNELAGGIEGGWTKHQPSNEQMTIYDASVRYEKEGCKLIIIAGKDYGTGSSRDWAAKGTYNLGCKAVIALSFERIHRSNLVHMGVLPLQFKESSDFSKITGKEEFHILGLNNDLRPKQELIIKAGNFTFAAICRLDTPVEVKYYRNGGILHTVLRQMVASTT